MIASKGGVCIEGGCSEKRACTTTGMDAPLSPFFYTYAQTTVIMENAMYGLVHKKGLLWRCIA